MELTRRNFLKGFGAAAIVGTALTIGGVSVEDAVNVGRVYFFPKTIKLAKSLAESNYFVKVDVRESDQVIRREIFDPKEFYENKYCTPVKVEFITMPNVKSEYLALGNPSDVLKASPKIVHNPDGSKWTYGRLPEEPYNGTRNEDWGRIVLTDWQYEL
jgi:hypothetical protein